MYKQEQIMLAVRLDKAMEDRLERLAEMTNRSKSYYARKAIEVFIEDQEDYLLAIERLKSKDFKTIPIEKLGKALGLESNNRKARSKRHSKTRSSKQKKN
jgi:RHH-type rel operon transcriptional repressor/antitoxin RelB